MTTEYVAQIVSAYPAIREVWLYGSRANGTEKVDSDWDYLAFADDDTLSDLSRDARFHRDEIDLVARPWPRHCHHLRSLLPAFRPAQPRCQSLERRLIDVAIPLPPPRAASRGRPTA